ncbi:MAG: Gfo/Idh/MocA family oxidoreductase [Armatimonadetes bacterium]|nr:Gfo/Idh/MocA family oxidoreductase [Armatimonadota bacterium]
MAESSSDGRPQTTRRRFLTGAAIAAAGAALRGAPDAARVVGANDRISWGLIGCGPQGTTHLHDLMAQIENKSANCAITAVCDIYQPRKEAAQALTQAKLYHNYEDLLADDNVDVVLVASPEHWHAKMTLDALRAGKDVYCEKPMTRHWEESVEVARVAREQKRVLQIGTQWTSQKVWHRAHELLPQLGQVVWSQTSYCRNSTDGEWNSKIEPGCTAETLDWKRFLGPAPDRPFSAERYFRWRKYWDYSSGICGDLLPHQIGPLMIVLGAEMPVRVVATGSVLVQKDREVPDTFHMLVDFASGHTMLVAGCTANEQGLTPMVRGHEATMLLGRSDLIEVKPERIFAEDFEPIRETVDDPVEPRQAHQRNFMDCVRSRQEPNCGLTVALPAMLAVGLAEVAYRETREVVFDAEKLQIVTK